MKINGSESYTIWHIEHDGLSYVRTHALQSNGEFISWKRNFDWNKDISNRILDDKELEELFLSKVREDKLDKII